ncbi:hypothetical protein H072_585 [Dactylellina haptotyla CBS 200.50]|uniref:Uncharacterized protein n=1 Tax=Dactylellina haptotyla (strain CBS 200.50) TaxID=1284197 RepID=S8C137_DACHA|nr:hypothetical protein H072_585 [Dactylellina haptotyla CBS 200.50]
MSSNPFRRKQNDRTPTASGRTSLDIDQERLQQVAQQAFADGDDDLQPAGSSGPTTAPDIPPSSTAVETVNSEAVPTSQPQEATPHDGLRRSSTEIPEPKTKIEIQPETPVHTAPSSISSAAPIQTAIKPPDAVPTPPPSRPLAPPAPPRPRRSVRRPPDRALERKMTAEEPPVAEEPVPEAPKANDPFLESKLQSKDENDEDDKDDDESSIYEIRKEEAGVESVKSIESEYEEDSGSEISEVPTASAGSMSAKTVSSEPEYAEASAAALSQAPNPFRKKEGDESPIRRQSLENERYEIVSPHDVTPPAIKFGVQNSVPQSVKANRQSLDVEAFKHLMLTGQATQTSDSVTTTETNNVSKQSLLEGVEASYTPRSSQDTGRSTHDVEDAEYTAKVTSTTTPPPPKAKPPPPKPRGQRNSMMAMPPPYRSEPQSSIPKEIVESANPQDSPATPPKTPKPPVPLSRRISVQVVPTVDSSLSIQSASPPQPPPPPPPPSRRVASGSSPKDQSPTPPALERLQEPPPPFSLNVSALQNKKPTPPPTRRGSKRMSAPPGRLQAPNLSKAPPAPPPPPIRKKSQLSQSTTEGGVDMEPAPRVSASFDILEDLTKLQKEVDELMGRV